MSRWLTIVLVCGSVAAWVGAQNKTPVSPAVQARLYQRNHQLVRLAVESSLDLSGPTSTFHGSLERAAICTKLARRWAAEIESAARLKETDRASELAAHLERVIDRGVSANLRLARQKIEEGSELEKDLFRSRDEALGILEPLGTALRQTTQGVDIRQAVQSIDGGVQSLKRAAKVEKK